MNIKIAIIDVGIFDELDKNSSIEHFYLNKDQIVEGYKEPLDAHGTLCLKEILKQEVKFDILDINIADDSGKAQLDGMILGIKKAIEKHADIINISLGVKSYSEELYRVCQDAIENNIAIISAASHSGNVSYPANFKNVLCIEVSENSKNKILKTNIVYTVIICLLAIFGITLFELWLINNLIKNNIPVSKFVLCNHAFLALIVGLFSFIEQIVFSNRSMLFLDYLVDFLNYKVDSPLSTSTIVPNINNDFFIEFKNVSFKYLGSEKLSIKNLTLKLKKGDKVCIVGENGSGKTTLVKLLLNIYEPTFGKILLNGVDIKKYNLREYQKIFGTVFQDFTRYLLDIKSNIGIGDISRIDDMDYMKYVSQITNSKRFIEDYSLGYNTKVSKEFYQDAVEPSVGQWQKLAISRAIFRNAPFLILDEPTASLDPKAEEEIFNIFDKLGKEKTVLIISHRMYSAKLADKIILLQNGEILETGTHEQLINKKGKYNELYSLQAKKYTNKDINLF